MHEESGAAMWWSVVFGGFLTLGRIGAIVGMLVVPVMICVEKLRKK